MPSLQFIATPFPSGGAVPTLNPYRRVLHPAEGMRHASNIPRNKGEIMFSQSAFARRSFVAFALVGAFVSAQAVPATQDNRATNQKTYPMTAAEFDELRGQFALQSGVQLHVTRHNRKFYLNIEGQPALEILPTGANAFADQAGAMTLVFNQARNGNVYGVTLTQAKNH